MEWGLCGTVYEGHVYVMMLRWLVHYVNTTVLSCPHVCQSKPMKLNKNEGFGIWHE